MHFKTKDRHKDVLGAICIQWNRDYLKMINTLGIQNLYKEPHVELSKMNECFSLASTQCSTPNLHTKIPHSTHGYCVQGRPLEERKQHLQIHNNKIYFNEHALDPMTNKPKTSMQVKSMVIYITLERLLQLTSKQASC